MHPLKLIYKEPWNNYEESIDVGKSVPVIVQPNGFGASVIAIRNISYNRYILLDYVDLPDTFPSGYKLQAMLTPVPGTPNVSNLLDAPVMLNYNDIIGPGDEIYLWVFVSPPSSGAAPQYKSNTIFLNLHLSYVVSSLNIASCHWFPLDDGESVSIVRDMGDLLQATVNGDIITPYGSAFVGEGNITIDEAQIGSNELSPLSALSIVYSCDESIEDQYLCDMDVQNAAGDVFGVRVYVDKDKRLNTVVSQSGMSDVSYQTILPHKSDRINVFTFFIDDNILTNVPTIIVNRSFMAQVQNSDSGLSDEEIIRRNGGYVIKNITIGSKKDNTLHLNGYIYSFVIYKKEININDIFDTHGELLNA